MGLSGVGPKILEKLERLGIYRLEHLLLHLPRDYEDRTRVTPINQLRPGGDRCQVEGVVVDARVEFFSGQRRLRVKIEDDSGATLELYFMRFNRFQQDKLAIGVAVRCYGEVKLSRRTFRMFHPEFELITLGQAMESKALTPVYPTTEGLAQVSLRKLIERALVWAWDHREQLELPPWEALFEELRLPGFIEALQCLHTPALGLSLKEIQREDYPSRRRLILEELVAYQISFLQLRARAERRAAEPITGGEELIARLRAQLAFTLTGAQEQVLREIRSDLAREVPMMRLLQGDVGSGKTLVAVMAALCAVAQDIQVAVMAPTELLAKQHYRSFWDWLYPLGIEIAFLSSSQSAAQKQETKVRIQTHQARIVIGTHALIQEDVEFDRLGLLIIDEQHRFGVHQRLALRRKGETEGRLPHQLIMTATPIPRSLAMTFYADLEQSVIGEMPPGRKPVRTVAMSQDRRAEVLERIREVCGHDQQTYWVCTLVEDSEVLQCEAAERTLETLREALPQIEVGLVHGRMKAVEKEQVMQHFKSGKVQLLVATTVIEVGVDVPNATLMVIENAERLGLAQLHQLRGRIGRGQKQSACVLLYRGPLSENAQTRIQAMRETTDGFEIARMDLRLRGPGQLLGSKQAGEMVFRVADLSRDERKLQQVHQLAERIMQQSEPAAEALMVRWLGESRKLGSV